MESGNRFPWAVALAVAVVLAAPGAAGAASTKSATATVSFSVGADGRCYPVSTATWSGYQVNRVRHVFYRQGHTDQDYAWLSTTGLPNGTSQSNGTMTSTAGVATAPGEGWYTHDLFRSNGGAILAEATSNVQFAPVTCPVP